MKRLTVGINPPINIDNNPEPELVSHDDIIEILNMNKHTDSANQMSGNTPQNVFTGYISIAEVIRNRDQSSLLTIVT